MTPDQLERVFGRARLKMATGEHVEVYREATGPGERRRYTKRFLATSDADFREWTQREWRVLARLIGHGVGCVPDVVQFDGGAAGGLRHVQTYDAGTTVDQWASLLPVTRDGAPRRHVFEDAAHWWALALHCLRALDEVHALELVHLDVKADNLCIPYAPVDFDPRVDGARLHVVFNRLALIDFAFSVVSRERLSTALPLGWQKDYDYQSPRLLRALEAGRRGDLQLTEALDWRCDLYSLAAMLRRYLPDDPCAHGDAESGGWTPQRYEAARALVYRLRDIHDRDLPAWRPHRELMEVARQHLAAPDLALSLTSGWTLATGADAPADATLATPVTRIAAPLRTPMMVTGTTLVVPPARAADVALRAARRTPLLGIPVAGTIVPGAAVAAARRPARVTPVVAPAASVPVADPAVVRTRRDVRYTRAGDALPPVTRRAREVNPWVSVALAAVLAGVATLLVVDDAPSVARDAWAGIERLRAALAGPAAGPVAADRGPGGAATPAAAPGTPAPVASASVAPASVAPASEPAVAAAAAAPDPGATPAPMPQQASAPVPADAPGSETREDQPVVAAAHEATPAAAIVRSAAMPASSRPVREHATVPAARADPSSRRAIASAPTKVARSPMGATGRAGGSRGAPLVASSRVQAARQSAVRLDTAPLSVASTLRSSREAISRTDVAVTAPVAASAAASPMSETTKSSDAVEAAVAAAPAPPTVAPVEPARATSRAPGAATTTAAPRARPSPVEPWRAGWRDMLSALGLRNQRPAPIEDRGAAPQATPPAAPPAMPPNAPAAIPASPAQTTRQPAPPSGAPLVAAAPLAFDASPRVDTPSPASRTVVTPAPLRAGPAAMAAARRDESLPDRPDFGRTDGPTERAAASGPSSAPPFRESLPRVAELAHADVAQLLWAAATLDRPFQEQAIAQATARPWRSERAYVPVGDPVAGAAFHARARQAFARGRDSEARDFAARAFEANPRDPNLAGLLAFLELRAGPQHAETARQLVLNALAFSGARRSVQLDDWDTLAVASALTGRHADAAGAFLVGLAISGSPERACRVARDAYATYGERLRVAVEALQRRVRLQSGAVAECGGPTIASSRGWQ